MHAKSTLKLVVGGAFSLLLLAACNPADPAGPSQQSAQVKGKPEVTNPITKPVDSIPRDPLDTVPWCGTPIDVPPEGGQPPVEIPHTTDPVPPVTHPDSDGFEPIDWSAKALPGSEGWYCSEMSPAVCATNGKSYRNMCEAAWSGLGVAHAGKCK